MDPAERSGFENGPADPTYGAGAAPTPVRRAGRWLKIATGGMLGLLFFIAFAPQFVGWSSLRHEWPRLRLRGFTEKIRVERASLSWWGPVVLTNVELYAPDGKVFAKVASYREDRSVWDMLFHRYNPVQIQLDSPQITVLIRPDGSNVEDAMAPVLAYPRHPRRHRTIEVIDGAVRATDAASGRTAAWEHVSLHATIEREGPALRQLTLSAELADAPEAKPLNVTFARPEMAQGTDSAHPRWEVTLDAGNLPLTAFGPVLTRIAPDLDFSGTITAHLRVQSGGDGSLPVSLRLGGDWQLTSPDLTVNWPRWLGDDRLTLGETSFDGGFSLDKAVCRVKGFKVLTDVCRLEGNGAFSLDDFTGVQNESRDEGQHPETRFDLSGDLDLVRLAKILSHTLPRREGAELTEGKVSLKVSNRLREGSSQWTGRVGTTKLAALVGGEPVSWDEPLNLTFDAHRQDGRLEIDSLECRSEIFQLTGSGNTDKAHVEAHSDLATLAARLGEFFDTRSSELRGQLSLTVDLSRDPESMLVVETRGDVENLQIRRLATKYVERRAGDQQDFDADEPPVGLPPPQAMPGGLRTKLSQRRADRAAKKDLRRREKELQQRADQIVRVPIQEWRTIWDEPRLTAVGQGRLVPDKGLIELERLEITSDGLRLAASGDVTDLLQRIEVDLHGEATYDIAKLIERVRETVGPHLQVAGRGSREFSIKGPFRNPPAADAPQPIVALDLTGRAGFDWQSADLFGLQAAAGELSIQLAEGIISAGPLDLAVSGGKLKLAPSLDLRGGPVTVVVPAGPVMENIELTDEVCDGWLKYIAPVLAQATRADGRFSLDLEETRIALADPGAADVSGRLRIDRGQVLPGALMIEIGDLIGRIVAPINGGTPPNWLAAEKPLVRIDKQDVEFRLKDRRIHHDRMEFNVRNVLIRTRGSVGLDQTLDLVAEISLSDEMLNRAKFLGQLRGRTLEIPIQGTLKKPRVDRRVIARLATELVPGAIEGLINQGVKRFQERR